MPSPGLALAPSGAIPDFTLMAVEAAMEVVRAAPLPPGMRDIQGVLLADGEPLLVAEDIGIPQELLSGAHNMLGEVIHAMNVPWQLQPDFTPPCTALQVRKPWRSSTLQARKPWRNSLTVGIRPACA